MVFRYIQMQFYQHSPPPVDHFPLLPFHLEDGTFLLFLQVEWKCEADEMDDCILE